MDGKLLRNISPDKIENREGEYLISINRFDISIFFELPSLDFFWFYFWGT